MRLDVLIPTLDRGPLLERALRSVLAADRPARLDFRVTVVLNGSTDDSAARVAALQREFPGLVAIVHERRRGKSRALNTGIALTCGDLVGMIDDDEEVGPGWLQQIARVFADPSIEFAGGPYIPVWDAPSPSWVPAEYLAVLGSAENGPIERDYGRDFPGILKGGNAVIRRRTLRAAGPYAEYLGPARGARLFSCEDEEMYWRLVELGVRGRYVPDMVVYHHVLASRLTPEYYRRWCFWRGVSRGLMDCRRPLRVPYFAGVPRFLFGRAARGLMGVAQRALGRAQSPSRAFADELAVLDVAGFWFGRHIYTLARCSPVRSRRHHQLTPAIPAERRKAESGAFPESDRTLSSRKQGAC